MEEKDIEVIPGDGSDLNFSPVSEHLSEMKPKPKDTTNAIIIPEVTTGNKKNKRRIKLKRGM